MVLPRNTGCPTIMYRILKANNSSIYLPFRPFRTQLNHYVQVRGCFVLRWSSWDSQFFCPAAGYKCFSSPDGRMGNTYSRHSGSAVRGRPVGAKYDSKMPCLAMNERARKRQACFCCFRVRTQRFQRQRNWRRTCACTLYSHPTPDSYNSVSTIIYNFDALSSRNN